MRQRARQTAAACLRLNLTTDGFPHKNTGSMDLLFYLLVALAAVGLLSVAAILLFKRDRWKNQERQKRTSRRDRNLVVREATRRLSQDPRDIQALQDLAEISFDEQNFSNAYKHYSALLSLCGVNPQVDEFAVNLRLGQSAFKLNKIDEAYKHLLMARTLRENDFEVNFNLGLLEYAQKDYQKACAFLGTARRQRPDDVTTNRYLGHSLYSLKDCDQAVEVLQRALDFEPEDKKTQFILAKSYYALKNNDLALQIFSRLRTDPEIGAISALHSGTLNANMKRYDTALEDFEIGLRHENIPQAVFLELKYRKAEASLSKGDLETSIRLWKEINTLQPNYKDVVEKIGHFQEINTNRHLQTYLLAQSSEFVTLCRKLAVRYFNNATTKLVNISLQRGEFADILAEVHTTQWEEMVLFRFIRSQGAIGELLLRDLYARSKELRAGRSVCVAAGSFSEQAQSFVEARLIDLVDRDQLLKILSKM